MELSIRVQCDLREEDHMKGHTMTLVPVLLLFIGGCDDGGGNDVSDTSTDTSSDVATDTVSDTGTDVAEDPPADMPADTPTDTATDPGTDGEECTAAGPVEVTLTTEDGINLIADVYTTGTTGAPSVILLHEYPLAATKATWPATFIDGLVTRGYNVINVNRRGATGSEGDHDDAWSGPLGKWDARAGYEHLAAHACTPDMTRYAILGASNGTTTAVDFSMWTVPLGTYEQPAAMVFLSGGSYTETQYSISGSMDSLDNHPILFVYPADEATWNEGIAAIAPTDWVFQEYPGAAHGTQLLTSNPESVDLVYGFLDDNV
jgi:hypothetical protein